MPAFFQRPGIPKSIPDGLQDSRMEGAFGQVTAFSANKISQHLKNKSQLILLSLLNAMSDARSSLSGIDLFMEQRE